MRSTGAGRGAEKTVAVKFTGQVRVPEVDHPGVPATLLVENGQAEVFLDGETLGRWSLYDVRATRLVSSAFSLLLAREEITFIADEPVDFAYKGVDHMAEVWARYKSMTLPRRLVAVGRSRRGTLPSRIGELREAMLQNLEAAVRGVPRLAPIETLAQTDIEPDESAAVADGQAPVESVPQEPIGGLAVEQVYRPSTTASPESPGDEAAPAAMISPPLRPGAGLFARRIFRPETPVDEPAPVFASPTEETPVLVSPWDEPAFDEEPAPIEVEEPVSVEEPEPEDISEPVLEEELAPSSVEEPEPEDISEPVLEEELAPLSVEEPEPEDISEPVLEEELAPLSVEEPEPEDISEPVLEEGPAPLSVQEPEPEDMPEPLLEEEPKELAPVAATEWPELVKELFGTSSDEGEEEGPRDLVVDLVVDLGHYRDGTGRHAEQADGPQSPEPDTEPVLAGASAAAPDRSGLLGVVRSAFARNKAPHEHEFTEAPGGIGIVRQICGECGYISIGLSD